MTKRVTSVFLVIYICYLLIAVVFKMDYFPMTWAPMYSAVVMSDDYVVSAMDKDKLKENGFLVKHRDGTESKINYKDLNLPFRSFWRIYSQRPYNIGP